MKRVLILSAAVLFCGVPLRAQVTKQVEVTKTYVPEVSKAVKLPIVPDMTDTVRLRPEIAYTVTPSALATNLSTEPFRPATVSYWEFDRPRPLYLKVGAGAPLNSVLDLYASTQNPGTGYVVGYLNHTGDWADIRNDFGVRPTSWRMHNRMGAAAGKYLGRRLLEGKLDLTNRVYHNYGFDGAEALCTRYGNDGAASYYPFTKVSNDRQHYDDAMLHVRIGDDFTDLSRFNFNVELRGGYFLNVLQMQPVTMTGESIETVIMNCRAAAVSDWPGRSVCTSSSSKPISTVHGAICSVTVRHSCFSDCITPTGTINSAGLSGWIMCATERSRRRSSEAISPILTRCTRNRRPNMRTGSSLPLRSPTIRPTASSCFMPS